MYTDFDDFRKLWIKQHRGSTPNRGTKQFVRAIAMLLFLSSAIVSGAHTIPAIAETLDFAKEIDDTSLTTFLVIVEFVIAFISLFMVEVALFGIAFAQRMELTNRRRLLYIIQTIALLIAISGNLYFTFKSLGILDDMANANFFKVFLGVTVGIGAPLSTMLAGELLAGIEIKNQQDWKDIDAKVLAAWTKEEKRIRKQTSGEHSQAFTERSLNSSEQAVRTSGEHSQALGYSKNMDSRVVIEDYLREHPEIMNSSLDKIKKYIQDVTGQSVGRTSIHNVRKELAAQNGRGNGHRGE